MNSIPGFDFEDSTVKATVAFLSGSMGMSLKVMSACHWHVIGMPLLLQSWSHLVSIGFCLNSHVQAAISLAAEKRGAEGERLLNQHTFNKKGSHSDQRMYKSQSGTNIETHQEIGVSQASLTASRKFARLCPLERLFLGPADLQLCHEGGLSSSL